MSLRDLLERGLVTRSDHQYEVRRYTSDHDYDTALPDPDDDPVAVGG